MLFEIKDLSKEYKRGNKTVFALKNVNISVSNSEFIAITGHSGSGKSTLLNLAAGLLLPTSGEVLIDGKNIFSISDKELSFLRNSVIGYIYQGQNVLNNLTVLDNVCLPFYLAKREGEPTQKALDLLSRCGIEHLAKEYPYNLSGGELRRVSIARALINNPFILLADEPTSNLDYDNKMEIIKLFKDISDNGTAVIMATHEMETIGLCDLVYEMNLGVLKTN